MKPTVQDVDDMEDDLAAEEENKLINEEYKTWKKNAPYLYDLVITHALDWPSLTCQWFPDKESPANKPYTTHRLLLGTHTSGQAQDYLQIATVQIPKRDGPSADKLDRGDYDDERGELGGHSIPPQPRIQIIQKINHAGEVNRARYMPQNPNLIATKAISGEVFIFDRTKHSSEPERGGVCKPDIRLVGQTKEGFGLAWSPAKAGHVLGASEDMTVCHWDVNSYTKTKSTIEPTTVFRGHTSVVGDVDWHPTKEDVLASVGDDKMLLIWDTRTPTEATIKLQAHDREILACAFSPSSEHLIITGSSDKTIVLHDVRSPNKKLHTFESHTDEVLHLAWSPHNPTIFASASSDRRVNIWDLSQIGVEQTPDDQEDGPPELMFIHGGHTARPTDFCWAPGEDENWTAATTSEDNVVMVWQPTMRIWAGDEVKIDAKELEGDAMEGVESTHGAGPSGTGKGPNASGNTSTRSQSMSISATASVSGADEEN
ncbi:WD40 repeat-like protein [Hygrophoropsis aurantiaca]|uniref:WD40 repeat-like protein n=1 Tax=Hygrophoropsis aurantiaca TaxID=72124 RepID=A0ACB8ATK7_9AGAM|nr:WD40 repeat-like protein [Hygrophoropsis aurantiaca]